MSLSTNSTPAVRFEQLPIVEGPLTRFNDVRLRVLADVVTRTIEEFENSSLDFSLGEALYLENFRLKRERPNLFTKGRYREDKILWSEIQSGLLSSTVDVDRKKLLRAVVKHYAEEICGRFDPRVYRFSTRAVPWGFSWLLNAASVRRFLPWGMSQSLESRLKIVGEISHLQKLANRGTILLVPTHQSNIDSVLIGYVIYLMSLPPFSYGAGLNLFTNPVLSFFMGRLGAYTVDRKKSNQIYKHTLKNYSTRILREGVHSIFFPGGGRSRSGAIETHLKLGLLGTGLEAQIQNMRSGKANPNIYVVPMTTSYHSVLEASSLIEDYLAEAGKHRYIITDDESFQPSKIANFFWKMFSSQTGITVRIGKPLDVFGNPVDEEGHSIGPNGTSIDPRRLLTTRGELTTEEQRDREYTHELGEQIVHRFHEDYTVMTSHVVAFVYFEALRRRYPELDLYRFLRLGREQRTIQESEFLTQAEALYVRLTEMEKRGQLHLSDEMKTMYLKAWVDNGIRQLGLFHDAAVVKQSGGAIWTEDMNLLYYYRNRLTGYGLTEGTRGKNDRKGFLA